MEIDASHRAVALDHDEDSERIVAALGGSMPTCTTIVRAFANPTAVTLPNDPRFVAYCADPGFVSSQGMEQVRTRIALGSRIGRERDRAHLQRVLLEAAPTLRMRWLVRWLDVVAAMPEDDNVFRGSAEFVAYRIAGAGAGPRATITSLQCRVLDAWERAVDGVPDWSVSVAS